MAKKIRTNNLTQQLRQRGHHGGQTSSVGNAFQWNAIDEIYSAIANGLVEFSQTIADNLRVVEEANRLSPTLLQVTKTAITDCVRLSEQIADLKKKHGGMSGRVFDVQMPLYFELGDAYNKIYEQFRALSFQAASEITVHVTEVMKEVAPEQTLETVVEQTLQQAATTPEVQ